MDGDVLVVTSGSDSHTNGLHPLGRALDFRGNSITADDLQARRARGQKWCERVKARLGENYDVLFEEFEDPTRDHLHVEYDPKG